MWLKKVGLINRRYISDDDDDINNWNEANIQCQIGTRTAMHTETYKHTYVKCIIIKCINIERDVGFYAILIIFLYALKLFCNSTERMTE